MMMKSMVINSLTVEVTSKTIPIPISTETKSIIKYFGKMNINGETISINRFESKIFKTKKAVADDLLKV